MICFIGYLNYLKKKKKIRKEREKKKAFGERKNEVTGPSAPFSYSNFKYVIWALVVFPIKIETITLPFGSHII